MKEHTSFNIDYYKKKYKSSFFHKRGDNPCVHSFWVRYIRRLKKNGKLLEVGCGEGYFLKRISPYFNTWGIDISRDGISIAKRIAIKTNFEVGDATSLQFNNDFFDVIVAFDVIEHLRNPELFFGEAFRALKNDGILVIRAPNPYSIGAKLKGSLWQGYRDLSHISLKFPKDWNESIKKEGFSIIRDGTDTLWDAPYFKFVPVFLQKIFFLSLHQVFTYLVGILPWKYGENYICIAKK